MFMFLMFKVRYDKFGDYAEKSVRLYSTFFYMPSEVEKKTASVYA